MPLRRSEAPSRVRMPMRLLEWILTSLMRLASSWTESVRMGEDGSVTSQAFIQSYMKVPTYA